MTISAEKYVNYVLPLEVVALAFGMYLWMRWVHAGDPDRRIIYSLVVTVGGLVAYCMWGLLS